MAADESIDDGIVHQRLQNHDERLTRLERWKERVMGAILTIAFILGSGGVMSLLLEAFIL